MNPDIPNLPYSQLERHFQSVVGFYAGGVHDVVEGLKDVHDEMHARRHLVVISVGGNGARIVERFRTREAAEAYAAKLKGKPYPLTDKACQVDVISIV